MTDETTRYTLPASDLLAVLSPMGGLSGLLALVGGIEAPASIVAMEQAMEKGVPVTMTLAYEGTSIVVELK